MVHHIPMTHRAGERQRIRRAEQTNGSRNAAARRGRGVATPSRALPFGAWPSPITAADVARGRLRIAFPTVIGGEVWWQEGRPEEGGRVTVVHRAAGGKLDRRAARAVERPHPRARVRRPVLPAGPPVVRAARRGRRAGAARPRDRVRELRRPAALRGRAGRRRRQAGTAPDHAGSGRGVRLAGLDPAGLRYADFALSPDRREIWCVQERHSGGKVTRAIVAVPLDGSAAEDPAAIRQLVTGSDFFAFPTPSPDGTPPGLDLLESPAHAVGRHRAPGRCCQPGGGAGRARRAGRYPLARAGWSRAACASRCWPRPGGTTPACTW